MDWARFVYSHAFTRKWDASGFTHDDLVKLEIGILGAPNSAPVIPETGGLRKVRFSVEGRGKRGGARICYVHFPQHAVIHMTCLFLKNEQDNLSRTERHAIAGMIREIEAQLDRERER